MGLSSTQQDDDNLLVGAEKVQQGLGLACKGIDNGLTICRYISVFYSSFTICKGGRFGEKLKWSGDILQCSDHFKNRNLRELSQAKEWFAPKF